MHFLECVLQDQSPMVSPEGADRVMETYAPTYRQNAGPVRPSTQRPGASTVQELYKKFRTPV